MIPTYTEIVGANSYISTERNSRIIKLYGIYNKTKRVIKVKTKDDICKITGKSLGTINKVKKQI